MSLSLLVHDPENLGLVHHTLSHGPAAIADDLAVRVLKDL